MDSVLSYAALILSIVNAIMLLRHYIRDRPILVVNPVLPDVYQWWFHLPAGEYDGIGTRRYGLLLYIGIANKGLRNVTVDRWRLWITTQGGKRVELRAMNLPTPTLGCPAFVKTLPVLGQKNEVFEGNTDVQSGHSIAGMAYFTYECYGDTTWDPRLKDGMVACTFNIKDVFGGTAEATLSLKRKSLDEVKKMVPDIEKIW